MNWLKEFPTNIHPKEKANIFSNILFLYTLPLFWKGTKKEIKEEDIYKVLTKYKSTKLVAHLSKKWTFLKQTRKRVTVLRLLWVSYGRYYLTLGVLNVLVDSIILIFQPYAVSKIVSYFVPFQTQTSKTETYLYASALIGIKLFICIYKHNNQLWIAALGIRIRAAFYSLIYRKILRIDYNNHESVAIGKFVTMITKDVETLEHVLIYGNEFWIILVKTTVACVVLYVKIGTTALVGIALIWILLPIQLYAAKKISCYEKNMCEKTEVRYKIVQEAVSVIKLVKMYTWEEFFKDKASKARKKEVGGTYAMMLIKNGLMAVSGFGKQVAMYALLMTYIKRGNEINSQIVFFVVTCFQLIRTNFTILLPISLNQIAKFCACVKRIDKLLKAEEIEAKTESLKTRDPIIEMKNVTVSVKNLKILEDLNLKFAKKSFTVVTGPLSSGKTVLLKTILGGYRTEGTIDVEGTISYASQKPWLFSSTIRENILFGQNHDERRYQKVLQICALDYDCEMLENGDCTIVEDGGTNLSKGQCSRINLARAVYKNSDIYLLDDSLSSLDPIVRTYILQECICKFLKEKLVILVTQNESDFKYANNIVFLDSGRIKSVTEQSKSGENVVFDSRALVSEVRLNLAEHDNVNENTKLIHQNSSKRNIYSEEIKAGQVKLQVYKRYVKSGGGFFAALIVLCVIFCGQFVTSYNHRLMSSWINVEQKISNFSSTENNSSEFLKLANKSDGMIHLYAILMCLSLPLALLEALVFVLFTRKASIGLHKKILNIFNASMQFFDTHLIGNVLNRFSKDFFAIDEMLPFVYFEFIKRILVVGGVFTLIIDVNTTFLVPCIIFLAVLVVLRWLYLNTARNLARLDSAVRSPVVGYINSTIEGITTIRAFKTGDTLISEFNKQQDLFTSTSYMLKSSTFAFTFVLDFLCIVFVATVLAKFLLFDDGKSTAGGVGLALSQANMLILHLQLAIRQWAEVENEMTSVERVLEYADAEKEKGQGVVKSNWPEKGEIRFKKVFLTYPNNKESTLKDINFIVERNEKIGIVGRTGAGKSSLFSALFRLYDFEGTITIDDVDVDTLDLENLRSSISIIPQDAVLFTGTIRDNIDPKRRCSDEDLWRAIESANLGDVVSSLEDEVVDGGAYFSAGQKQLFSLARAIVSKNKVVLLDEPTANLDPENIVLIQNTIWRNFASSTVLMIAHTMDSILKCDKVMVLDKGAIVECGPPKELLAKSGIFLEMFQKTEI